LQQEHIVPDVGVVVGVGRVYQARVGRESRRADSRSAPESVDFETGVVGEYEVTGSEARIVDSFERGVVGEGGAIFFGGWDAFEVREEFD
jgi:hypothetical protein